ncbi:MAG: T9SS type A sorting domain-containing protein [Chitinophagales bacterium]|nr:T9SS type A sorting domain-containing protein [Chitinophagales bacterium]MBP8752834.1 T9SS type A sorting domain-containing protein [Chitinophagales bacterium]MBP9548601.1 T9SS type A sorting domain-containing protein [Chitinophagales bacterium]MBP9703279.1 T9SS type A sorting domain-containing protein [Chitinophagales bacterium]
MRKLFLFLLLLICEISFSQTIVIDGTMDDPQWGAAIATSAGGPTPGFGADHVINAIYVDEDADYLYFGIAGNVQEGNRILMFLDTQDFGYNTGNFGRSGAPSGLHNISSGITFDFYFNPDYCLTIGTNAAHNNFFWDLYTLSGTAGSGGGPNNYLGDIYDAEFAANPDNTDITKGFEFKILKTDLGLTATLDQPEDFQLFICYIANDGTLSNQFLTHADSGAGNYGNGAVNFDTDVDANAILVDQDYVLPITLSEFVAEVSGNGIALHWQTATELNNDYFEIQHSDDGMQWNTLATIKGAGNSSKVLNYYFTDYNPALGINYYRLKQVDFNGEYTLSQIKSAVYNPNSNAILFPNPVGDYLKLNSSVELIQIFNVSGKMVLQSSAETGKVDVSDLASGTYFIKIISGENYSSAIFIKQ